MAKTHDAANVLINAALAAQRIDEKSDGAKKTYSTYADIDFPGQLQSSPLKFRDECDGCS